ncbi:MAG TPA: hypothetical protein PK765_06340 [bacterium]|nr:hypothetical protein [bacterium]
MIDSGRPENKSQKVRMNPRQKTDTPTRSASQEFLDRASDEQRDAWATEIDRVR